MPSTIGKETFQRLALFYLIGCFEKGVFSSFRLQKVLYYATRDVDPKPFTFHHTSWGQYSREAANQLLIMLESQVVKREKLAGEYSGALWQAGDDLNNNEIRVAFEKGFPDLAKSIAESVCEWGYLKQRVLDERVHADEVLAKVSVGCELFEGWQQDSVQMELDEDTAEDYAMLMSSHFISMMNILPDLKKAHGELPAEWTPL